MANILRAADSSLEGVARITAQSILRTGRKIACVTAAVLSRFSQRMWNSSSLPA